MEEEKEEKSAELIFNALKKKNSMTPTLLIKFCDKLIDYDKNKNNKELTLEGKMKPYINQLNEMNNPSHAKTDIEKEEKNSQTFSSVPEFSINNNEPVALHSFLNNPQNNNSEIMNDIDDSLIEYCFEKINIVDFNIDLFMKKIIELCELYNKQSQK